MIVQMTKVTPISKYIKQPVIRENHGSDY